MSPGPAAPRPFAGAPLAVLLPGLLAALYGWAVFASTFEHPGAIGIDYNAPGSDWMVMYEAARLALSGRLPLLFDGDAFTAHLNTVFAGWLTGPLEFRPWVYPPSFLLVLAPFAGLGFVGSYLAFQFAGAALLMLALAYRAERPDWALAIGLAAVLSPAASINVVDGQCSFLVAALLIGAFRLLGPRPLLAGVLVGLLTFKPQFGLLVPVALIALRQWRCLASATVTAVVLVAVSAAVFGVEAWTAWGRQTLDGYLGGDPKWVEYGRIWGNSLYACAVLLGAPAGVASLVQTGGVLALAAATWAVFSSRLARDLKLAVLLAATILAAPHSASYDAVLLVAAAGLWLAAEPGPPRLWRWILALALWLSPLFSPPLLSPPGRLTPVLLAGFIAVVVMGAAGRERLTWRGFA